jgi:SulP family sulfate permease
MVIGTLVSVLLNLFLGTEHTAITTVGALPATLPPLSSPALSFAALKQLAPAAVAMTLFALTEAVTIARSLALRSGQYIDGNQEFVGQGLSNIVGAFFSSYVATGSFNRSALNYEAGANTPLAAVFAAFFLMLIVVLLAPLTAFLPNAAMAGILFLVAWRLIDIPYIKKITRASRGESFVLITTFIATLLLDLEFAILLGVTRACRIRNCRGAGSTRTRNCRNARSSRSCASMALSTSARSTTCRKCCGYSSARNPGKHTS